MNIKLTPALNSFVTNGVRDGLFASVDAAIEEGLELLARQKRQKKSFSIASEDDLLSKLDAGLASLDAGKGISASEAFATFVKPTR